MNILDFNRVYTVSRVLIPDYMSNLVYLYQRYFYNYTRTYRNYK